MSYALTSTTNIETILTDVKEELGLTNTTAQDFLLRRYINEALKEMFTLNNTEQNQEVIDIVENSAKLPCKFIMFNKQGGWRFFGEETDYFRPIVFKDTFFKSKDVNNKYYSSPWESVQQVGDYLYFQGMEANTPRKIEISGLFLKCNEDGTPYIPEEHRRPAVAYACYKYIRARMNVGQNRYTGMQMNDYKVEWSKGKKSRQARSKMPSAMDKQVARRLMNALLG